MTQVVSFRIDLEGVETLRNNAARHGSSSISDFARDSALNFMFYLLQAYEQGITDIKNGRIKD